MKTISYCVTTSSETEETIRLLDFLTENIRGEDEIIVLLDRPKAPEELVSYLHKLSFDKKIKLNENTFINHFADWKNKLLPMSAKNYLFQIDADEMISKELMEDLHLILEKNDIDVFGIVRKNKVEGITKEHIQQWNWRTSKDEDGSLLINYPDTQLRIIKNNGKIGWKNRVHEIITGHETISLLPEFYYLTHNKTIDKQKEQNYFYDRLGK